MKKELIRICEGEVQSKLGKNVLDVNLLMREGECINLIGSETSGRRTLVRLLAGENRLLSGSLRVHGELLKDYSRNILENKGIYYINTWQPFINALNLAENFFLMRHSQMRKTFLNKKAIRLRMQQVLDEYQLDYKADCDIKTLSQLDRLLLNIVKSVDQGANLIVLDEVTLGLTMAEIEQLLNLIRKLKNDGIGIIISDNWSNCFDEISDCLVLMQDGRFMRKLYSSDEFLQQNSILHYSSNYRILHNKDFQQNKLTNRKMTLHLQYQHIRYPIECYEGESILLHSVDQQVLKECWQSLISTKSLCQITFSDEIVNFHGPECLIKSKIAFWDAERPNTLLMDNLTSWENILLPSMKRISSYGMWKKNGDRIFFDRGFWGEKSPNDEEITKVEILCNRWKLFHPRVLFMHNVFSTADRKGREEILNFINELNTRDTTVIIFEAADKFLHEYTDKDIAL